MPIFFSLVITSVGRRTQRVGPEIPSTSMYFVSYWKNLLGIKIMFYWRFLHTLVFRQRFLESLHSFQTLYSLWNNMFFNIKNLFWWWRFSFQKPVLLFFKNQFCYFNRTSFCLQTNRLCCWRRRAWLWRRTSSGWGRSSSTAPSTQTPNPG